MSKEQEFMNKVLYQILSETSMDCGQQMIFTPFMSFSVSFPLYSNPIISQITQCFIKHCKEVYSLKKNSDIDYIWKEYVNIINRKAIMKSKHIALAEKYGVKQVFYTNSSVVRINGKIYSVQMTYDVETLFEKAKGKTLNIYEGRMNYQGKNQSDKMGIGGFITEE